MRLTIDHRTRYRFSEPQARVVQLLRMTPLDDAGQMVLNWRIDVDKDARLRSGRDGYGNWTTMLYLDGPLDALEIRVTGEVVTTATDGQVRETIESLPAAFFLRETMLTQTDSAIAALVEGLGADPTDSASRAQLLNATLFERVACRPGRSPKSRTAAETLAAGWGSVRDCAQLLVAAARTAGLPARFVSGHCLDGPNTGDHKSAHCWAEIHLGKAGWAGFDPTSGKGPGEKHVRVAIGLDARDGTPLSGTRTGGGVEELDVNVRIAAQGNQ